MQASNKPDHYEEHEIHDSITSEREGGKKRKNYFINPLVYTSAARKLPGSETYKEECWFHNHR